jgi:hypothetical protein
MAESFSWGNQVLFPIPSRKSDSNEPGQNGKEFLWRIGQRQGHVRKARIRFADGPMAAQSAGRHECVMTLQRRILLIDGPGSARPYERLRTDTLGTLPKVYQNFTGFDQISKSAPERNQPKVTKDYQR